MKHDSVTNSDELRDGSSAAFCAGLMAGALIGAGLGLWFAPRAGSEMRGQLSDSARAMGKAVTNSVDEFAERGRDAYERVRAVATRAGDRIDRLTTETAKGFEKGLNDQASDRG